MIAGFIIQGTDSKPVLLRGMGPSLAAFGIQGVLLYPVLELRNSNSSIATNDNWGDSPDRAQFEEAPSSRATITSPWSWGHWRRAITRRC